MAGRPRLFTYPFSHYCVSVERMLAFKRIGYEPVRVSYHDRRELLAATGQDYVPALVWDGKVVTWKDIPETLERRTPRPTLFPPGKKGLARTLENWGHQVLEERVWRYVVTKVPPHISDEAERWVFEEMQTRARGPWHVLESRREEFRNEMVEHLALVEEMLDGKEWLLDEPSIADFGVYGGLYPLLFIGEPVPPSLPNLARWTKRVGELGGEGGGRSGDSPTPGRTTPRARS